MTEIDLNKTCCDGAPGCCTAVAAPISMGTTQRKVALDFLYLDLNVCDRCQGADASLEQALGEVGAILAAAGVEVAVNKIHVDNAALAEQYRFISSPTIRIDGQDIQLEVRESRCESCGDLCGESVDCRLWVFQGQEYAIPPKGMIIEAVLKAVYGGQVPAADEPGEYVMPGNLRSFYAAMAGPVRDE